MNALEARADRRAARMSPEQLALNTALLLARALLPRGAARERERVWLAEAERRRLVEASVQLSRRLMARVDARERWET